MKHHPGAWARAVDAQAVAASMAGCARSRRDHGCDRSALVRPDGMGLREVGLRDHETRVDLWSPDGARIAGAASLGGTVAPQRR